MTWKCYWDDSRICENDLMCGICEFQPEDSKKKNFGNPPMKPTVYSYGMPMCPACGEPPYRNDRCVFCGQKLDLTDAKSHIETVTTRGGHEEEGKLVCDRCGSSVMQMIAMGDGHDDDKAESIHSYTYNCENGHVITKIVRHKGGCE